MSAPIGAVIYVKDCQPRVAGLAGHIAFSGQMTYSPPCLQQLPSVHRCICHLLPKLALPHRPFSSRSRFLSKPCQDRPYYSCRQSPLYVAILTTGIADLVGLDEFCYAPVLKAFIPCGKCFASDIR